ncbi:MAG: hypothetical protein GY841_10755 [FCB group bacterium]|nr:hypothetical protein [FCB group bacterium]
MHCRKVRSCLSTYFRQELPADTAAGVKKHLEDCSSCQREAEMVRSVRGLVKEIKPIKASDGFNTALMQKIGQEGQIQNKNKARMPGRIPRFGMARLATVSAAAMVVLAFSISLNLTDYLNGSFSPPMAEINSTPGINSDRYLTVQPTDNPLLNERKSVSNMVKQYNRWREYSRSLRSGSADQFSGNAVLASSRRNVGENIWIRPVIKNYLVTPVRQRTINGRSTY